MYNSTVIYKGEQNTGGWIIISTTGDDGLSFKYHQNRREERHASDVLLLIIAYDTSRRWHAQTVARRLPVHDAERVHWTAAAGETYSNQMQVKPTTTHSDWRWCYDALNFRVGLNTKTCRRWLYPTELPHTHLFIPPPVHSPLSTLHSPALPSPCGCNKKTRVQRGTLHYNQVSFFGGFVSLQGWFVEW